MCPTEARTSNPLPRYFSIVFALAGDSTITNALLLLPSLNPDSLSLLACLLCDSVCSLLARSSCSTLSQSNSVPSPFQRSCSIAAQTIPPLMRPTRRLRKKSAASVAPYHGIPPHFHRRSAFFFAHRPDFRVQTTCLRGSQTAANPSLCINRVERIRKVTFPEFTAESCQDCPRRRTVLRPTCTIYCSVELR